MTATTKPATVATDLDAALAMIDESPATSASERKPAPTLTQAIARKCATDTARTIKEKTGQVFSPQVLSAKLRESVTLQVREALIATIQTLQDTLDNVTADGISLYRTTATGTTVKASVFVQQREAGFGRGSVSVDVGGGFAPALAALLPVPVKKSAK